MPGRLPPLSGQEVVRVLESFGFEALAQRGSHVKLRRLTSDGRKQTLVVPFHRDLDRGALRAIRRQAARYVPENDLRRRFHAT